MEIICCLLSHNTSNASKHFAFFPKNLLYRDANKKCICIFFITEVFRELGGARLAHNMVPYLLCRTQALNIVSTLLLTTAGEDDMSTLLGLMHTAKMEDLELNVLKVCRFKIETLLL